MPEERIPIKPEPLYEADLGLEWALSPAEIGRRLVQRAVHGSGARFWPLPRRDLLGWALVLSDTPAGPAPKEALALVVSEIEGAGDYTPQSRQRLFVEMALFVARLDLLGIQWLNGVDQGVVQDFIDEAVPYGSQRARGWAEPALATRHFRRSAVRLFLRIARRLGLCDHDPTTDIVLPARSPRSTRPLTDDEIRRGEAASQYTLLTTRLPAAWALAEATAVTSEIAAAQAGDVDLRGGRVWLHGCGKRSDRWGELTEWGIEALSRRLQALERADSAPLIYAAGAGPKNAQAATCVAVRDVLVRAGLHRVCDVRPASVAAWGGARVFRRSGRIEDVARALGLRSLDQAALAIGYDWTDR